MESLFLRNEIKFVNNLKNIIILKTVYFNYIDGKD
ncbi:MAG: hypothetical protein RIS64_3728 [Bacteroidota bacterium]